MSSFTDAFATVVGIEGGYSNNPADPGGETMYGITIKVARANGYMGAMQDMPLSVAENIYLLKYWNPLLLNQLPNNVALQIFDCNVNGGLTITWMQKCSGSTPDGVIGPKTIAAINATAPMDFLMKFNSYRLTYYTSLNAWPSFGKGWVNRIAHYLSLGGS